MSQALQKYSGFELDDAGDIEKEMSRGFGNITWMKVKVGKNRVRFLPAKPPGKPFKLVWEHQINFNGKFTNFACPKMMAKKPCPVCDKIDKLKASGNPADYARAENWFPRRRIYSYVIDRAEPEAGPKLYAFGKKVWDQLNDLRQDEDMGGDFTDVTTGFDIVIKRKGSTKNDTEYTCRHTSQSPLEDVSWVEQAGDLSRFGKILTPNEITTKLGGNPGKSDSDDDDNSTSKAQTIVDADFEDVDDDGDESPF